jgi:hypothetical protein
MKPLLEVSSGRFLWSWSTMDRPTLWTTTRGLGPQIFFYENNS